MDAVASVRQRPAERTKKINNHRVNEDYGIER
jgi:hypothetical protein